jgi:hypothetical protein
MTGAMAPRNLSGNPGPRTPSSNLTMAYPGGGAFTPRGPVSPSPITPGTLGGGNAATFLPGTMGGQFGPGGGDKMYRGPLPPHLMPGPSGEYGSGQAPMTAEESNEWLNAGNYTGGGYATIQSLLAAENARRWGDAPGEAPAGNQLNFGEITPGSKGKHWTWGAPPETTAGGAPAGPLIDPVSGQPLETPDGRPINNPNPTAPPGAPDGTGNLGNDVQPWGEQWAIPARRPIYGQRRTPRMRPMGRSNTYIS